MVYNVKEDDNCSVVKREEKGGNKEVSMSLHWEVRGAGQG